MKALVIDDNRINMFVAEAVLSKLGFEVSFTNDPQEGIDFFRSGKFDLVLTDYEMPVINGIEVVKALRQIETEQKRPRCLLFAASASAALNLRERFLAADADLFFVKPLTYKFVKEALDGIRLKKSG
jgi:two-component system sensor histidine kinase EvgS